MSDIRLSFKEMCERFDVTPRTLRYYEYIELLHPEREGRARFYGPREVERMIHILRGRKWGFQLEGIRQWLLIYEEDGYHARKAWVRSASNQLEVLRSQLEDLKDAIETLEQSRANTASLIETEEAGGDIGNVWRPDLSKMRK
ncbi:MerR family transcriptional regulator [Aquicoccus sp. G2-2]|jgi:DNA-binding transcriptional MerR regulator|uniref:MerR family transcriptional regulator n=1 Tax=Aquicoccus sp. G2-2 TaxID=3092120 RepID=UPI002ADFD4F1|nr:MerR family transcriptional regulator [Aquicoccus sp. G2-2]MEA1114368.1 MerR family transcriptional regulator [Aquicoccus sp. G2-2]